MEDRSGHRRQLGKAGEDVACSLLRSMGHIILERNWRSGHLEIDIISLDRDGIHFVEVKTREHSIQAPPQENVGYMKQCRTAKAALSYLKTAEGRPFGNEECMFDVIAVTFKNGKARTEWFPQAYIPLYL